MQESNETVVSTTTDGITVVVDTRETALWNLVPSSPTFSQKMLDLGDVHFVWKGQIVAIIERKTLSDLSASITDKRFYEQKTRLLKYRSEAPNQPKIMYTIETEDASNARLPLDTLESCMLGIFLSNPIHVIRVKNAEETMAWILKIQSKLDKLSKSAPPLPRIFTFEDSLATLPSDEGAVVVLPKKNKNALENPFLFILTSIPGIGKSVAEPVIQKYKNLLALCKEYSSPTTSTQPELMLADLELSGKNGKKRKVGKAASQKIYNALAGMTEKESSE